MSTAGGQLTSHSEVHLLGELVVVEILGELEDGHRGRLGNLCEHRHGCLEASRRMWRRTAASAVPDSSGSAGGRRTFTFGPDLGNVGGSVRLNQWEHRRVRHANPGADSRPVKGRKTGRGKEVIDQ